MPTVRSHRSTNGAAPRSALLRRRSRRSVELKFRLDYDGDYKDVEEYVFHDIDDDGRRARILKHFRDGAATVERSGVKVLTDVDDTLYANLMEGRYPKKTLYPGVLEMYEAIHREPAHVSASARIPITTLSARPNPVGGILEEGSIASLVHFSSDRLLPVALSGRAVSSIVGTLETLGRGLHPGIFDEDLDDAERAIGEVKYLNFKRYAAAYPEYRFVFFGDSGQADALTADLMLDDEELSARVLATFIHDLREGPDDHKAASPSFLEVERDPPSSRFFVSRNYVQAAIYAYEHLDGTLLTAGDLATIAAAALRQLAASSCSMVTWSGSTWKTQSGRSRSSTRSRPPGRPRGRSATPWTLAGGAESPPSPPSVG